MFSEYLQPLPITSDDNCLPPIYHYSLCLQTAMTGLELL